MRKARWLLMLVAVCLRACATRSTTTTTTTTTEKWLSVIDSNPVFLAGHAPGRSEQGVYLWGGHYAAGFGFSADCDYTFSIESDDHRVTRFLFWTWHGQTDGSASFDAPAGNYHVVATADNVRGDCHYTAALAESPNPDSAP